MIPNLSTLITLGTHPSGYTATVGSETVSGDAPRTVFASADQALFAACERLRPLAIEDDALVFLNGAWAVVNVLVPCPISRLAWQPFEAVQVA